MELSEIKTFVAVAEAGSVNRAALALHLSQPAVTRQVQRLEAALGVQLLDRRAKPATLTPAGQTALERCRSILKAIEELRAATAPGEDPSGECRIGVSPSLADFALAEPIDHLRRVFPRVRLQVSTDWSRALQEQVRAGVLDAAVVLLPKGERPPAEVSGKAIGSQPLVVVAPRRRRLPGALDLADLAEESWVLNPEGCGFRSALQRALQRINAPLRVAVEAHGLGLQLSLVARGIGLGLVPVRVVARSRLRSKLQVLRLRGHDFRLVVWVVYARLPATLTPILTVLGEQLKRAVGGGG